MGKKSNHAEGGIGGSLKNSLSKFTGRVTLKAPPAEEQPKAKAAKPVMPTTPKPMSAPSGNQPKPSQPTPSQPQNGNAPQSFSSPQSSATGANQQPASAPQSTPQKSRVTTPSPQPTPAASANPSSNSMANDVSIEGKLRFSNNLVFDGRLKGEISSNGALSLLPNALVEATIAVKTLVVAGKVVGSITATESVHLAASAVVIGDIATASLTMEPNASFQGQGKIGQPTQAPAKDRPASSPTPKAKVDVPPAPAPAAPKNSEEKNGRAA